MPIDENTAGLIGAEAEALADEDELDTAEAKGAAKAAATEDADDEDDDDDTAKPAAKADADGESADDETDEDEGSEPAEVPALKVEQPFIAPVDPGVEDFDYEVEATKIKNERADLRQLFRDGDITQEEFDEKMDELSDRQAELAATRERIEAAAATADQVAKAQYIWTLNQVKAHIAKEEGIDYNAPENSSLLQSWDAKVRALASDSANADKPVEWFLLEAHKQVKADIEAIAQKFGYAKGDKAAAKAPVDKAAVKEALDKRTPKNKPKTLATLPNVDPVTASNEGEFAHLDGLEGLELEAALAGMSPDKARRYLDGQ